MPFRKRAAVIGTAKVTGQNPSPSKGTVFVAPSGAKRRKDPVFKEIISQCPENNYSSVIYIGPNNYVISAARNEFHIFQNRTTGKSAYSPFRGITLNTLALDLHEKFGDKNVISDHVRTLVLCEILKDKSLGHARILSDFARKIRHYMPGRDISGLQTDIRNMIFEEKTAERAVWSLDIVRLYEEELEEKHLLDQEGLLKECISLLKTAGHRTSGGEQRTRENARHSMFSGFTLVIDGFYDPTPLELEVLGTLIDTVEKVFVIAEEHSGIIHYLQSHKKVLTVKMLARGERREKAGYISCPSIEEEVEWIAKNIGKCIVEGIKPWEITVCFPSLSKYLPLLRRVLPKYGIPLSIGECSLSATPPFIALEEMIACIEGDYSRTDFLAFLTSPYFPAIPAPVKEKAVSYAYSAGVVKGINSWLSIKQILLNAPRSDVSGKELSMLHEFQDGIKLIIDTFEAIKGKQDRASFIDAFESALDHFGFFAFLAAAESDMHGDGTLNTINSQFAQFRYFSGLYASGGQHINPPVFYLKHLLSDIKGSEENRDGVKIMPFELAAGAETKVLFFGGMQEGDFPSRPGIDPLLPESVKKELGMPHLEYYMKRQKRYFMRLLNISLGDPYFSCHQAEGDKVFLPSPFLDWEQKMPLQELNIFSEEECLIREGAARRSPQAQGIFHGSETFQRKKTPASFIRGTGVMSREFLSVTDIDYYRKCPLRFYIEKVLGFEIIIPPRFEVEARLWGSLAHKTMEHLFQDGDIPLEAFEQKLLEGLGKSLKQFPIGDFWAGVAREIFQKLLPALKEQESALRRQGYLPCKVEEKITAEVGSLKLKGKVDRADVKTKDKRHKPDVDRQYSTVVLLDYKTGTIDRDSLQLPLYAAMWEKKFDAAVEKLGHYSLKDGRVIWSPGKITMNEYIQNALHSAEELVTQMRKGIFSPAPFRADECRYCYHSPLCAK